MDKPVDLLRRPTEQFPTRTNGLTGMRQPQSHGVKLTMEQFRNLDRLCLDEISEASRMRPSSEPSATFSGEHAEYPSGASENRVPLDALKEFQERTGRALLFVFECVLHRKSRGRSVR
jgi:hypothetical protein